MIVTLHVRYHNYAAPVKTQNLDFKKDSLFAA